MLVGITPFYDEDQKKMLKIIKKAKVGFPEQIKISDEGKDLVKRLLVKDPKKRLGVNGWESI